MAKLKKDKWLRERESTLPPFDAKRFEANLLFNPKYYDCGQGGQGVEVTVKRSFDPEIPQSLAQIKWSFGEQSVPVLVIEEGDVDTSSKVGGKRQALVLYTLMETLVYS